MVQTKTFMTKSASGRPQAQVITQQINKRFQESHPKKYKTLSETIIELTPKHEMEVIHNGK